MPEFLIDLTDGNGARIGSGPIASATRWRSTARMDRAGSFSCSIPASDEKAAYLAEKQVLICTGLVDGQRAELGGGIIDKVATRPGADGHVLLEISGDDLLRELAWRSVGFLELSDGSGGGVSHAAAVASLESYAPAGWTFVADPSPGHDEIYARFAGESVLTACMRVADASGCHFYLSGDRELTFASAVSSSGVRAVQAASTSSGTAAELCTIVDLSREEDAYDEISRIYPFGAGQGRARLTLAASNRTAPSGYTLDKAQNYIRNDAVESGLGRIERWVEFKEIAPISNTDADLQSAANVLYESALQYLQDRSAPAEFYRLRVAQCAQLLRPMQTIRTVFRQVVDGRVTVDIDADLRVLEASTEIDANGLHTTDLLVATQSRWPETNTGAMVDRMAEGQTFQAHPQLNANAYTTGYIKHLDADEVASFRFRFGDEVTQVQQVLFEFQALPLESTVKAVAGETTVTDTQTVDYTGVVEATATTGDMDNNTSAAPSVNSTGGPSTSTTGSGGGGSTGSGGGGATGHAGEGFTGNAGGGDTEPSGSGETSLSGNGETLDGGPISTDESTGSTDGPAENSTTDGPDENATTDGPAENSTTDGPNSGSTTDAPDENATTDIPAANSTTGTPTEGSTTGNPEAGSTTDMVSASALSGYPDLASGGVETEGVSASAKTDIPDTNLSDGPNVPNTVGPNIDETTGPTGYDTDENNRHVHFLECGPQNLGGVPVYFHPNGDHSQFYTPGATGRVVSTVSGDHVHHLDHAHGLSGHTHSLNDHKHGLGLHRHQMGNHKHGLGQHQHGLGLHTHGVGSHTHGLGSHRHGLGSHTHGLGLHRHGLGSHTHGLGTHTHGLGTHTHGLGQHKHAIESHKHIIESHNHIINDHTHNQYNHQHSVVSHSHSLADHTHTLAAHTHNISHTHRIDHTHDISHAHNISHQHTFTPNLSMTYGIYREAAANTFDLTDLEYQVNGSGWSDLSTAEDAGSGWWRLDLSALVMNSATLRPVQANNVLDIRRRSAGAQKTATIDALLSVRNIIQAIAYV